MTEYFKINYNKLSESEKIVIEYIETNIEILEELSITDIANNTFTSVATVSRAVNKCGFKKGLTELRYKIRDEKEKKGLRLHNINEVMRKSLIETENTIKNLSQESILNTVSFIKNAKRIFILANGITSYCAMEFEMRLNILGFNTFFVNDYNINSKIKNLLNKKDMLIIFSLNDYARSISEAAKQAYELNIPIIGITCNENSRFLKYASVKLVGYKLRIKNMNGIESASRIPLNNISRIIIDYLRIDLEL